MKQIQKRFPANVTLTELTFLNDPKVDAELYAYLQSMSYPDPDTKETKVRKKDLPSQETIAKEVLNCSRNTVGTHLKYLKENGYITDTKEYLILNPKEEIFFQIPLDLLQFFINTVKQPVIKTYIYLGQRYKYKPKEYVFTMKEIAEHLGLNYRKNYSHIKDYLEILSGLNLIKIAVFYDKNLPYMRLTDFKIEVPNQIK